MSTERNAPIGAAESPATQKPRLAPPPREASASAPPPRLKPPPRVAIQKPSSPAAQRGRGDATAKRSLATWITLAFFGVLILAGIAVFVVLPDWVQQRQETHGEIANGSQDASAIQAPSVAEAEESLLGEGEPLTDLEQAVVLPSEPADAATFDPEEPFADEPSSEEDVDEPTRSTAKAQPGPAPKQQPAPPARQSSGNTRKTPGEFELAMSEGLAALEGEDFAKAREAFGRAAGLRPGSPQSSDGLARAEAGARLVEIKTLHDAAREFESQEDWHNAQQRYEAVLEIDPAIGFAIDGRARSSRRAELSDRIDFHLTNRTRLSSDEVLQEASTVLDQASELRAGPKLEHKRQQLTQAIQAFSTAVTATLESDQLTEVLIYKVGRLGTFSQHALDLRPGTYTVVGSRHGFRDVRRQLVIEPGRAPQPLTIRCEEKI